MYRISEITESLGKHPDPSAIGVLEELGTNSSDQAIRKFTAEALVRRNTHESLKVVIINTGKGIHDLNTVVSEATVKALKALSDKAEALRILDDTMNLHSDVDVRNRASEVRELICK